MSAVHRLTFVLPGDNRSGGVRVTALMANELIDRGHDVRIAVVSKPAGNGLPALRRVASTAVSRVVSRHSTGWLSVYRGLVEKTPDLALLRFSSGEIVIAVGTYTIDHVMKLKADAKKIRYNHGLPSVMTEEYRRLWSSPMPTITVSQTLVSPLQDLTGQPIVAVVPNGIDPAQYYDEHLERTGIGLLYNSHPNKAMHVAEAVVRRSREAFPDLSWFVFGTEHKPGFLNRSEYWRYPSIDKARELYNRTLAWIVTSNTEGLPGAVLESMSCGTPVVSTDNDGSMEVVAPEINGLVVPREDPDAFIPQISRLVADRKLWSLLSTEARKTAAQFSWQQAATKMEAAIETLSVSSEI